MKIGPKTIKLYTSAACDASNILQVCPTSYLGDPGKAKGSSTNIAVTDSFG